MEGKLIQTLKGTWVNPNLFVDENGEVFEVYSFTYLLPRYKNKWPFECYVNIYHNGKYYVIAEVLEDNTSLESPVSQ